MKVVFTDHAKKKFRILKEHGFPVAKKIVVKTVKQPDSISKGRKGRLIAQKRLDVKHLLRVIYIKKEKKRIIITFYPARRDRYED